LPFAIISFLNIAFNLGFEKVLSLNPHLIITQSEIWRIFSFPLIDNSIVSVIVLGLTILFFLPQLFQFFSRFHLASLLFLLLLLQGAMQFLLFWGRDIYFTGFSSMTSFLLVLTAIIYPKGKFFITKHFRFKNIHFILLLFLAVFATGLENMWHSDSSEAIAFLFPIFLGITSAISVVIQIYIFKKYFLPKRQARSFAEIAELLTHARESMRKLETSLVDETVTYGNLQQERKNDSSYTWSEDPLENESQLNVILDKILEHGQNSITEEEAQFLQKFSKNL
jgi:hypothetical protein